MSSSLPSVPSGTPPPGLEELARRLANVERRLAALERGLASGNLSPPVEEPLPAPLAIPVSATPPANPLPVIGRSLLGLAGAYVLRALADSGVLPPAAGAATGLVYAFLWLLYSARVPAAQRLSAVLSAVTSMLIMAPLLWEATTRLNVVPPSVAAAAPVVFVVAALLLARVRPGAAVPAIAASTSLLLLLALLLATRSLVPFTFALLVAAAAVEISECSFRPTRARLLAVVTASTAVLLFSRLISRAGGLPEGYAPASPSALLAAQLFLLLLYLASAVFQSVVRRRVLSALEMFDTALALLVSFGGIVWVFHANSTIIFALGVSALAAGLAFYAVSFLLFDQASKTNFRLWSTLGLVLVLAGAFLPFPAALVWLPWLLCALVCCWIADLRRLPTLGLHGAVYFLLAAAASQAAARSLSELFNPSSQPFPWLISGALIAGAALCWAAIALSPEPASAPWRNAASSLALSFAFSVLIAAALFRALAAVYAILAAPPSATLATASLTGVAVAVAVFASRSRRRELAWAAYALMALGAYKLLTRDFPRERNLTLVVSLLFFGGALILIPRILQRPRPASS